jgi:protein-S-isoprenylcysteine O-methyltransferase Ste14
MPLPGGYVEKMMKDPAGTVLALTVNAYWACVLILAVVRRVRLRQGAGLLPRKLNERLMWPLWVPVILAWNVLPWLALRSHRPPWSLPEFVLTVPAVHLLRPAAAGCAVACFLVTLHCWVKMGRSWSLAVVPGRDSELIRTGIFALVRHPIYGLSMVLMIGSAVVIPTLPMAAIALIHVAVLTLKARSEEDSLQAAHGEAYFDYSRQTGRFFPRLL